MIQRKLYMERISGFINQPEIVKIITGIRRCGKSVMLQLICKELIKRKISKENIILMNFEDLQYRNYKQAEKLHDYLKEKMDAIQGRKYLFLDEIQEVENWESCINSLRVNSDVDIYLTGSNAHMLAGEYATLMAGRYIEIQMHPFSFSEFSDAVLQKQPELNEMQLFQKYLIYGGMPFLSVLGFEDEVVKPYLHDIFTSVVIKDIMKRNNFRDVDLLERIIIYIMSNVGRIFSAGNISKFLKSENRKVSVDTVLNYLKGCEEAFLFYKVKRQDIIGKKILQVNEKYYIADHGLRESVYGNNQRDIELVLENVVYLELLRHGYTVTVGRVGEKEIDFVCDKADKRIYVQVCYLLASEETVQREFGVYSLVTDNYPKYVVSMDEFDMSRDGIIHKNIREFLKMEEY